jgi:hypothetical protein
VNGNVVNAGFRACDLCCAHRTFEYGRKQHVDRYPVKDMSSRSGFTLAFWRKVDIDPSREAILEIPL